MRHAARIPVGRRSEAFAYMETAVRIFFPSAGGLRHLPALAVQSFSLAVIDFAALAAGSFAAQTLPLSFRFAGVIVVAAALGIGGVFSFLSRPFFGPSLALSGRDDYARIYLGALVCNPILLTAIPGLFGGFGGASPILHAAYFQMPVNFIAIQIALSRLVGNTPSPPAAPPPRPPEDPDRYTRPYRPKRKNITRPM